LSHQLLQRPPHPAVGILAMRRITRREVARHLGVSENWVGLQLLGHEKASRPFRQGLSELLGIPEVELFDEDRADVPAAQQ
jgi:transcriptional regulator with XRE-family HTH domain